ncbi:serine/threonine protein kinase [Parazoarcus communis]|uniref:non-specific serine/threonine protein kinase n=1 Tax=Parazoarcus communis SWub3 = DSM 12120 TaxID=1121029 RepID=A0A323US26_9RHOO|nr:serine/threonine-protein kinase [Parazoarcus communis]NMG71300.1 protein kinase [Parazoarcus communis SWub3 = DSM 12120]PZA15061.1 hypothetical protein DNK49_18865 [Azoarcus communis] [Parazoarcus communis SWub3 = DSM 12120]
MSYVTEGKSVDLPQIRPANALPSGARLQEFEVRAVIGEGGFGIVYQAFDTLLERDVAIKEYLPVSHAVRTPDGAVVSSSARQQDTFEKGLRCFMSEARMLARFKHPALVEILRFWEEKGTAYMVMPLYRGRPLSQLVQEGFRIQDGVAMTAILSPLLDGLATLHAVDCYHRDISTDNILILEDGSPLLLDFGAARRILVDKSEVSTVILKPGFAPIEQYSEDGSIAPQGAWTDLYALSAVAYQLVTGEMPVVSVARIIRDPLVPLSARAPAGFPEGLQAAIDAGLRVNPELRPQSIAAFVAIMTAGPKVGTTDAIGLTPSASGAGAVNDVVAMLVTEGTDENVEISQGTPAAGMQVMDLGSASPSEEQEGNEPQPIRESVPVAPRETKRQRRLLPTLLGGVFLLLTGAATYTLTRHEAEGEGLAAYATNATEATRVPSNDASAFLPFPLSAKKESDPRNDGGFELRSGEGDGTSTSFRPTAGSALELEENVLALPVESAQTEVSQGDSIGAVAEGLRPSSKDEVEHGAGHIPSLMADGARSTAETRADSDSQQGVIEVRVEPWGNVLVNGKLVGVAPPRVRFQVDPGDLELEVSNETHPSKRMTITVEAGRTYRIKHEFGKD